MELDDLSLPSNQATLAALTIEQLPSPMLTKIFSYLPFKDRYLLVLVSSKWAENARIPWTDVTSLKLNSIPRATVDTILSLCPRLGTIEVRDLTIVLEKKPTSPVCENVRTMMLHEVTFAGKELSPLIPSTILVREYFERFPKLVELILRDCKAAYTLPPLAYPVEAAAEGTSAAIVGAVLTIVLLETMPVSLERLIVTQPLCIARLDCKFQRHESAPSMPQLRELSLVNIGYWPAWLAETCGGTKFPNLEVLVYTSHRCIEADILSQLITAKMPLRILVIAGKGETLSRRHRLHDQLEEHGFGHLNKVLFSLILPPRQVFPDCAEEGQPSLAPLLQIFVGGDFTKHVRFALPNTDVANFWRIDCPMPEYLAKPEVAAVFKEVWLAKVLRESPENGGLQPWGHPDQTELFFSTDPLLFC